MNSISAITLLIVDDEAEIRTGLRSIIPWEDYSVTVIGTAASGAEALDKIRYYEPNIVITDIQMPGMNGLELVRRAREEQFECSFIILSGYDDFEYARTAIRYGIEDYLLKPISIKELTNLICKLKESIVDKRNLHTDQLSTLHKLRKAEVSLHRQNLIPQLLRGELAEEELGSISSKYGLLIRNTQSCVVLIQTFRTRFDPDENVELNQSLVALKKILENELADSPVLISEYPPDGLILVVNLPFHHHTQESLSKLLNRCLASWRGDNLAAAIGNRYHHCPKFPPRTRMPDRPSHGISIRKPVLS